VKRTEVIYINGLGKNAGAIGIGNKKMIDWNKYMREVLVKLIPSQEKRKKEFFDECKKQTPSEEMQDELEPIPPIHPVHED